MTRSFARKRVSLVYIAFALLGALLADQRTPAVADTHSYASTKRQIRACVLVSNAASLVSGGVVIPENAVPYTFYLLDRRTDLKPAGWEFVNPLASSTVTGSIRQRWLARDTSSIDATLANPAFALGAPLTKNLGAYWEVNLDLINASDLQQFDVILMAYHTASTGFTPTEREALRKYVDGGGTIWLEDEGGFDIKSGGNHTVNQFIIDTAFNGAVVAPSTPPTLGSLHHPIVNFPYPITAQTVAALGAAGQGTHHVALDPISGPVNPRVVVPVIWSGLGTTNTPLVLAGDYGAGHIVISSAGIATGINSYAGGSSVANEYGNSGAVSGENILGVQNIDAEFAYNLIAWTSTVSTGQFNARRTGGSMENIGNGLGVRWSTIPNNAPTTSHDSGVAIFKNCAFYVDGNNVLRCYDLAPSEDLDNDFNPDDGFPDYINGAPYDEVWEQPLDGLSGSGFSSSTRFGPPTLFSVNHNGTVVDEIAVQGSNGVTAVFNAFTFSGGVLAAAPAFLYTVVGAGGNNAGDYAPGLVNQHGGQPFSAPSATVSEGVLFSLVFDNSAGAINTGNDAWRISATDVLTQNNVFGDNKYGTAPSPINSAGATNGMPYPIGSPAIGYMKDVTSGALDKVIQVPTLPDQNITLSGGAGEVYSLLYSAKNDTLIDVTTTTQYIPTTGGFVAPTQGQAFRAMIRRGNLPWFAPSLPFNGNRGMLPVCHVTHNGVATDYAYSTSGGVNTFSVAILNDATAGGGNHQIWILPNPALLPGDTITADYTIDWSGQSIPGYNGGPTISPSTRDLASAFYTFKIVNPAGTAPGTPSLDFVGGIAFTPDDMVLANMGDAPFADRIYAINNHFQVSNGTVSGSSRAEGPAVRWMFYPNGPVPDEGPYTGAQGLTARLINTDTFGGLYNPSGAVIATDLETIGAPAYSNGVAYQVGWGHMHYPTGLAVNEWDAAFILAYKANPNMTFVLTNNDGTVVDMSQYTSTDNNGNIVNNNRLQIKQVNIYNLAPGQTPQPTITLTENAQFVCDRATSTITIFDCRQGNTGDSLNLAMPFQVSINTGAGTTNIGGLQVNPAGYGLLDNLLWWMIVPMQESITGVLNPNAPPIAQVVPDVLDVQPASSPTVIGNSLYYGTQHGHIASIDLSNMPQDGSQATLFAQNLLAQPRIHTTPALWNTSANNAIDTPIVNPPVGTTDVVVASSPNGLTAMDNQLTMIADNNRLVEVNHSVQATWSVDATQTQTLVGGPLLGNGNIASAKISLSRPTKVQNDSLNTFVVADSGNNRVMEVNRGGVVAWELQKFNDRMNFLRPGDPVTLNSPTDVQFFTQVGNGPITYTSPNTGVTYSYNGYFYAYHYIIADSGNFRMLEVVDVVDINGNPIVLSSSVGNVTMQRLLVYVSQTAAEQSKALRYRTVQQFYYPGGLQYLATTVDNTAIGGQDPGSPIPLTGLPSVDAGGGSLLVYARNGPKAGNVVAKITSLFDPKRGTHTPIAGPTFFQVYTAIDGTRHSLLCDANGCYDLLQLDLTTPVGLQDSEAVISWALYSSDYLYMTGRPLRAASIQRLGQADYYQPTNLFYNRYLITNRYTGDDNVVAAFGIPGLLNVTGSQVRGEVVEVRSDVYYNTTAYTNGYQSKAARLYTTNNAGQLISNALSSAIVWMVPKETIPLGTTPAPIKRTIGDASAGGTSTYILEQPTYGSRAQ